MKKISSLKLTFLSSIGSLFEFYDFTIFVLLAASISENFFSSEHPLFFKLFYSYSLLLVGYLIRPISGIIFAHFSDTKGRKKSYYTSILMMAISTLAIGLIPTYNQIGIIAPILLLICRTVQGISLGGELPNSVIFIYEHSEDRMKGFGVGLLYSGLYGGVLLGSLISAVISYFFSEKEVVDFAWRIPFIIGGVIAFVGVIMRKYATETPVFKELNSNKIRSKKLPIVEVLKGNKIVIVRLIAMTSFVSLGTMSMAIYAPTYFISILGYSREVIFFISSISLLIAVIFITLLNIVANKFRTPIVLYLGIISSILLSFSCLFGIITNITFIFICFAFISSAILTYPFEILKYFNSDTRVTGYSFCVNIGFVSAGFLPMIVISLNSLLNIKYSLFLFYGAVSIITLVIEIIFFYYSKKIYQVKS